ncbi:MAG: hypothetical protein LBO66_14835 [Deltaproteobacteria bacterium]|jgi:hypothetical protein|nr:hypothetical protein [Deltaproteobacteria bacterium]
MPWPRENATDKGGYVILEDEIPPQVTMSRAYFANIVYRGEDNQPILDHGDRVSIYGSATVSASYFGDSPTRDIFIF